MTIALLVISCALAAAVLVLLGSQIELYRQVTQIRAYLRLVDEPTPVDLGHANGMPAGAAGLPAAVDDATSAVVLVLSTKCATCRALANSVRGAVPRWLWLMVEPASGTEQEGREFVEEFQLAGERTMVDTDGEIAERIGMDVTPLALFFEGGRLRRAETVPSTRHLHSLAPADLPLRLMPSEKTS
jgi:hypothetical protein